MVPIEHVICIPRTHDGCSGFFDKLYKLLLGTREMNSVPCDNQRLFCLCECVHNFVIYGTDGPTFKLNPTRNTLDILSLDVDGNVEPHWTHSPRCCHFPRVFKCLRYPLRRHLNRIICAVSHHFDNVAFLNTELTKWVAFRRERLISRNLTAQNNHRNTILPCTEYTCDCVCRPRTICYEYNCWFFCNSGVPIGTHGACLLVIIEDCIHRT